MRTNTPNIYTKGHLVQNLLSEHTHAHTDCCTWTTKVVGNNPRIRWSDDRDQAQSPHFMSTLSNSRHDSRSLIYRIACRSGKAVDGPRHHIKAAVHVIARLYSLAAAAAAAAAVPRRREGRQGRVAGRHGRYVIGSSTTHAAPTSYLAHLRQRLIAAMTACRRQNARKHHSSAAA